MNIPIENIYYLLCYAWNHLKEKELINISVEGVTELVDLFTKVLIHSTKILLKKGIDRDYIHHTEEVIGIKGKLQISESLKENLLYKQRTICSFDNLSSNILSNRILVSTISKLIRTDHLDKNLKMDLVVLSRMLSNIKSIDITSDLFSKAKIHRNNYFYQFIMNICRVIYEQTIPTEKSGRYAFTNFMKDENKMALLFESFVRNFYQIEQNEFIVKREVIYWQFTDLESLSYNHLPQMETDITLENNTKKIIIDTKFYKETMNLYYDQEKIKSNNLYQLFSYLIHQEKESNPKTKKTMGILLYPTMHNEYNLSYQYQDHVILIRTINLGRNWQEISERLKEIISLTAL